MPEEVDASAFLKKLCVDGLKARGMATSKSAKAQLHREVEVVSALELEEFFLVVREVVAFAPALAEAVFDLVSKFVGYSCCRSHATAFARTVYQWAF